MLFIRKLTAAVLACTSVSTTLALQQQVLSSFIFTRYGDRTPLYSSDISILTPYGAQQMYNAGSNFRSRYLTPTFDQAVDSSAIRDISRYQLNADEINILTTDYQYVVSSAQAFMQGLYPPLQDASNANYTDILGVSGLANGTNVVAPLHGYQYSDVRTASSYDLRSVWLDGAQNCPALVTRLVDYYKTPEFKAIYDATIEFYQDLDQGFVSSTFTPNDLGYFDAYYIYDYLQYEYLHNSTFRDTFGAVNMTYAQVLAADWVHALFGNATDEITSMAGRSLAAQVLQGFYNAIQSRGQTNKLNLWFGDYAPMVSFAALARLTSNSNSVFYNIPPYASSYAFELVGLLSDNDTGISFPNVTDLFVRFFFQNGTDKYASMTEYALFGSSPSEVLIPYSEFVAAMEKFSLSGIKEWCEACGSYSIFCPAYTRDNSLLSNKNQGRLSPAVAGVVGALVTLAVAAILLGLVMVVGGVRFHRHKGRRRSELAGFKGSQKLASDQDLTIPKGGAGAVVTTTEPDGPKGHERVGSWELREAAKRKEAGEMGSSTGLPPRRPSYEDDEIHVNPYAPAVKPHDQV